MKKIPWGGLALLAVGAALIRNARSGLDGLGTVITEEERSRILARMDALSLELKLLPPAPPMPSFPKCSHDTGRSKGRCYGVTADQARQRWEQKMAADPVEITRKSLKAEHDKLLAQLRAAAAPAPGTIYKDSAGNIITKSQFDALQAEEARQREPKPIIPTTQSPPLLSAEQQAKLAAEEKAKFEAELKERMASLMPQPAVQPAPVFQPTVQPAPVQNVTVQPAPTPSIPAQASSQAASTSGKINPLLTVGVIAAVPLVMGFMGDN